MLGGQCLRDELLPPVAAFPDTSQSDGCVIDKFKAQADKLEKSLTHESSSAEKHAKHFRDTVIPNMTALRALGDKLELDMPHELWPLATYREMLFIK